MGISRKLQEKILNLSDSDRNRMVRMGWEDRTSFDVIKHQFGFTENEFISFMRTELSETAFKRWRKRAHQIGGLKHEKKRGFKVSRFKSTRQTHDGLTKGWK